MIYKRCYWLSIVRDGYMNVSCAAAACGSRGRIIVVMFKACVALGHTTTTTTGTYPPAMSDEGSPPPAFL